MNRIRLRNGEFAPIQNYANVPISIVQAIQRKAFGTYPRLPWIPFAAIKRLSDIVDKQSYVWEVGAGNSTRWLAERAKCVVSIEADRHWFEKLGQILKEDGLGNVDLRYLWHAHEMADFSNANDLDLLYIDGGPRNTCLRNGFGAVKPGGYIYCDNVDADNFWGNFDDLIGELKDQIRSVEWFVDYAPASAFLSKGALLHKSNR